jgi:hypothetical protein
MILEDHEYVGNMMRRYVEWTGVAYTDTLETAWGGSGREVQLAARCPPLHIHTGRVNTKDAVAIWIKEYCVRKDKSPESEWSKPEAGFELCRARHGHR